MISDIKWFGDIWRAFARCGFYLILCGCSTSRPTGLPLFLIKSTCSGLIRMFHYIYFHLLIWQICGFHVSHPHILSSQKISSKCFSPYNVVNLWSPATWSPSSWTKIDFHLFQNRLVGSRNQRNDHHMKNSGDVERLEVFSASYNFLEHLPETFARLSCLRFLQLFYRVVSCGVTFISITTMTIIFTIRVCSANLPNSHI